MIDPTIAANDAERLALRLLQGMEEGRTGEAIAELCSPDFVWENSGLPPVEGIDGFRALAAGGGFARHIPILRTMRSFSADVLHLASTGDDERTVVFTERIDHHWDADGRDLMTPHICGVMEIEGGRITALRDFYDVAVYEQVPTAPDPAHAIDP
ncbi:MAG: limonene-1,2-epoxide hydrolase family protein [Actinomycetota bacterium]